MVNFPLLFDFPGVLNSNVYIYIYKSTYCVPGLVLGREDVEVNKIGSCSGPQRFYILVLGDVFEGT